MAVDAAQLRDCRARQRQQLKMDRQKGLADDVQVGGRQQVVNVGDPAGDRVLDRDHAEFGRAVAQRREGVLEGRAGQRLVIGKFSTQAICEFAPGSP